MFSYKGFTPLGDRVVIRPDPPAEMVGSIHVPKSAQGQGSMRQQCERGTVLAMGAGMPTIRGGRWPMPELNPGDRVVYFNDGGVKIKIGDEDLLSLRDDFVHAVEEA